jgi:hypothetical protein
MRARTLAIISALWMLTSTTLLSNTPAPRRSPELAIAEPSGKTTLLSSLGGKVVVVEFLFMNSEHCLRVARTLNKLQTDLGQRGLQSLGVVFGPNADAQRVTYLVDSLKLAYPVGYTTSSKVDSYLGRTGNEILSIPQVVIIDRFGMIRAASGGRRGDPRLEDLSYLRDFIDGLLKENVPSPLAKKRAG